MVKKIPSQVIEVIQKLKAKGFKAFLVGGCVRDLLLGKNPPDFDIATSAKPQDLAKIFEISHQEEKFGTTTLTLGQNKEIKVEITPFRKERDYKDLRHPEKIEWTQSIEEDLKRRDFTVNAIALDPLGNKIVDPFEGRKDLKNKVIKAVGNPEERFKEDALRMMRAARFLVQMGEGWKIEEETEKAIKKLAPLIQKISKERIRDELVKIIMTPLAATGIDKLRELGLLKFIIPELEEGIGVSQNKHHIYDCYEHALRSLDFAAKQNFSLEVRLAALFHDIAKPRVKKGEGPEATFYNHEVVGAQMTWEIMQRLKFPKKIAVKVSKLVRWHLFYYEAGRVTEASVRRLLRKVGKENIQDLIKLRMADRIGSGVPKALPYRLRHFMYLVEKVQKDPISPKMLKIKGDQIMEILNIPPGPKIGQILWILLDEVIEDPTKNNLEYLTQRTKELGKLKDKELKELSQKAKQRIEEIETKRDEMTKQKYWVS